MGLFDRIFRRPTAPSTDQPDAPSEPAPAAADAAPAGPPDGGAPEAAGPSHDNPHTAAVQRAVDAYWDGIGVSDTDRISYLLNPMFTGAPRWPGIRQSYRVVRTPQTLVLASDGLSDPDVDTDEATPGVGCEVFLETPDLVGAEFAELRASWQFSLVEQLAMNVAHLGGLSDRLEQHGVLSMELPLGDAAPAELRSPQGTVGVLLGMPVPGRALRVETPGGPVDLVAVTVVGPDELDRLVAGGAEARRALVEQRLASGAGHLSTPARR
ncbi:Suppressor of fused protein (SUFU) [Desertihabitans brevis]|uniref:Suppressor of fused protein (SUFU) n=1 Tax=Desertihabitans brevis TaxID=2268447 RepID=A0A367Z0M2_9ACTN|nr:suppressor of fused domain protein [Desertihabitans brevis]RCK70802.1 Suppressor of fused protein (SUFU) [Desertihabitans brevis]